MSTVEHKYISNRPKRYFKRTSKWPKKNLQGLRSPKRTLKELRRTKKDQKGPKRTQKGPQKGSNKGPPKRIQKRTPKDPQKTPKKILIRPKKGLFWTSLIWYMKKGSYCIKCTLQFSLLLTVIQSWTLCWARDQKKKNVEFTRNYFISSSVAIILIFRT